MLKLRGQLLKCSWGPLRANAEAKAAWAALKTLLDATPQLEAPVAAEELKAARQEFNDRRMACERDLQQVCDAGGAGGGRSLAARHCARSFAC